MIPPDGKEIVFAGAGILWGATTFFRGLHIWRTATPHVQNKSSVSFTLATGVALMISCSAYLAWSIKDTFH
jgi:hypothetical protein